MASEALEASSGISLNLEVALDELILGLVFLVVALVALGVLGFVFCFLSLLFLEGEDLDEGDGELGGGADVASILLS